MAVSASVSASASSRFSFTGSLTYASEYLTDGFRVGDASPVMQLALKLDLPISGVSLMYWDSLKLLRSRSQYDEHDLMALYSHDFMPSTRYGFNFHGFYDYWFFPNSRPQTDSFGDQLSDVELHGSKVNLGVSMTRLLPLGGSFLIPSYNVYYWIYWKQDLSNQYQGGARHELSLSYTHSLPSMASWIQSQYVGAFASLNYNDGVFGVRPGLSHSLATVYAGLTAANTLFTISANQQLSYQRTVNDRNDFWMTVGVTKEF
jgi:hypothetical protein